MEIVFHRPNVCRDLRLCLLPQLEKEGLGITALDSLLKAIVLNKILYCFASLLWDTSDGQRHFAASIA